MSKKFTLRVVRNSLLIVAAVAMMGFTAQQANAQRCGYRGYGGSGFSIGIGNGYGGYGGYGRGVSFGYSSYRPSYWHDTSHYDYHGPSLQRHRNHYHYVPGHWDYHRSGHWHH